MYCILSNGERERKERKLKKRCVCSSLSLLLFIYLSFRNLLKRFIKLLERFVLLFSVSLFICHIEFANTIKIKVINHK